MRPPKTTKAELHAKMDAAWDAIKGVSGKGTLDQAWSFLQEHIEKLRMHCADHRARIQAAGHSCDKLVEPRIVLFGVEADHVGTILKFESYADALENLMPYAPTTAKASPVTAATSPARKTAVVAPEDTDEIKRLDSLVRTTANGKTKQALEANLARKRSELAALHQKNGITAQYIAR